MSLTAFREFIPPLTKALHKGSNGRIGILGGSLEYTGAPYFAAISALKAGADLVHVFCCRDAAPVIKSYSPELIVHPLLDADDAVEKITPWLERLHALVIGPGLGRDTSINQIVLSVIDRAPKIPVVIDADGLHTVTHNISFFRNNKRSYIFTPNAAEYKRLIDIVRKPPSGVYLLKGEVDVVKIWDKDLEIDKKNVIEEGSWRRCGGQGDVLAGIVGTFAAWADMKENCNSTDFMSAAIAASTLTRRCSRYAFEKYHRGMVASNLIEFLPLAFEELLEK